MVTKVFASQEIAGICRKKDTWRQLIDIINFPERIPLIDVIRILEKKDRSVLSEWFISLDGAPFSWIEYAAFLPEQYTYTFRAISGDFDIYRGYWKLTDSGLGTLMLASEIEYSLGIPVIEENLGGILKEKMQQFLSLSVTKQCDYLSTGNGDERREARIPVNRKTSLHLDGHVADAQIINLSSRGMMFRLMKGMFDADEKKERTIRLPDCSLKGYLHSGSGESMHRLQFTETLSDTVIEQLHDYWNIGNDFTDSTIMICDVIQGKSAHLLHKSSHNET